MYNVSSEYLNAISQPVRTFKIEARFSYQNAEQAVFDDSSITGEVRIESQAVSGSASCGIIDIGAVPSATASLTIIDANAGLKKYTGSSFTICVSLLLENGEYENVPMGTFFCDSAKTSRTGNRISVYGYDAMITFKYTLTDTLRSRLTDKTPQEAASILTEFAKCEFDQDLSGFPNSNLMLDFSNTQIVTGWDGIMWIAQLMGCFARINRQNHLEFVQIKTTWEWLNDEHTLGTIVSVRNITGSERYKTTFSDDRIHIVGVSMSGENNKLITRSGGSLATDSNVVIALEKNPLIKSTYVLEDILDNILTPLQTSYFYAFHSEIISDPALDVGDMVRLQGGEINGTNENNDLVGFITHNTWRYRGRQEIVNTGQTTDTAAELDGTTQFYAQPKSQTEKLLDSLSGSTNQIQERVTAIEKGGAGSKVTNWLWKNGYGVRFMPVNLNYNEQTSGTSYTMVHGIGAKLESADVNYSGEYSHIAFGSTFAEIERKNTYKMSLGTPCMQFYDEKHMIGFKQFCGVPYEGDRLELYFGDLNKVTITKRSGLLNIETDAPLHINGKRILTEEDPLL